MTNKDIFKTWAPCGAKWVDWVRPVPFITIDDELETYESYNFEIPNITYMKEFAANTAIIIDLPSYESINESLALAKKFGYRPIPIYNGTNEQKDALANVNNQTIELALVWGAYELSKMKIENDAFPVFLLDSNRLNRYRKSPSIFDNSWDIYDQDMPSAEYFIKNGINKIIVRSDRDIKRDLKRILYKYQKDGIKIYFADEKDKIVEVKIKKPSKRQLD